MKQIKYNFLNIVSTNPLPPACCVPPFLASRTAYRLTTKTTNLGVSIYIKNDNMLHAHVQLFLQTLALMCLLV